MKDNSGSIDFNKTKEVINDIFISMEDTLVYLYDRWQEEKEYEDFQDYIDRVKNCLSEKANFISLGKRPFTLKCCINDCIVSFIVKANSYSWKACRTTPSVKVA